jgi:hypothetical protein
VTWPSREGNRLKRRVAKRLRSRNRAEQSKTGIRQLDEPIVARRRSRKRYSRVDNAGDVSEIPNYTACQEVQENRVEIAMNAAKPENLQNIAARSIRMTEPSHHVSSVLS